MANHIQPAQTQKALLLFFFFNYIRIIISLLIIYSSLKRIFNIIFYYLVIILCIKFNPFYGIMIINRIYICNNSLQTEF